MVCSFTSFWSWATSVFRCVYTLHAHLEFILVWLISRVRFFCQLLWRYHLLFLFWFGRNSLYYIWRDTIFERGLLFTFIAWHTVNWSRNCLLYIFFFICLLIKTRLAFAFALALAHAFCLQNVFTNGFLFTLGAKRFMADRLFDLFGFRNRLFRGWR